LFKPHSLQDSTPDIKTHRISLTAFICVFHSLSTLIVNTTYRLVFVMETWYVFGKTGTGSLY